MREITFLKKNRDKWLNYEKVLEDKVSSPDELAELYVETLNDLSYSRTYFPQTKTESYLNQFSAKIHQELFKSKKEDASRLKKLWLYDIPEVVYSLRKEILVSAIILIIGVAIGFVSSANDQSFVRLIMGDAYVNMTLENIKSGDPMAVYKSSIGSDMFLMITFNNVKVSFYAFIYGLFFAIGSAYIIFTNGVMLGAFHYMFYEKKVLAHAMSVIWIHGTIEISSIILSGAAGLMVGASFMFPGTYSRMDSFIIGVKKALKLAIGLVPFYIFAAILESFVTRYTYMPVWLSILIILFSIALILGYFLFYPLYLRRKENGRVAQQN